MSTDGQSLADKSQFTEPSAAVFSRRHGIDLDVVYCLSNKGMPGLFKIGFTSRTASVRARELYEGYGDDYTTGVPFPFEIVREWELPSGRGEEVEKAVHGALHRRRPNPRREYFQFEEPGEAVREIEHALQVLDWYKTAVAEAHAKQQEATLRSARKKAVTDAEGRERARTCEILTRAHREVTAVAEARFSEAGVEQGLIRAAVAGACVICLGMFVGNGHVGFWFAAGIAAAFTAFVSRTLQLHHYLSSAEFKERVAAAVERMETEAGPSGVAAAGIQQPPAYAQSAFEAPTAQPATSPKSWKTERHFDAATGGCPVQPHSARQSSNEGTTRPAMGKPKAVVCARCPCCGCLHAVGVSNRSYVRVECLRCGGAFETYAALTTDPPDRTGSRVYLATRSVERVETVTPMRDTLPQNQTPVPLAENLPAGLRPDAAGGRQEVVNSKVTVVQCPQCGQIHWTNAEAGQPVQVTCDVCSQPFIETAQMLTFGEHIAGGAIQCF